MDILVPSKIDVVMAGSSDAPGNLSGKDQEWVDGVTCQPLAWHQNLTVDAGQG